MIAGGCGKRSAAPRVALLKEVLAAKDDNDKRLDTAFLGLTAEERAAFRKVYADLPREKRNEQGTIVFLLGREAKDEADWAFLREVAAEPPCLSLPACGSAGGAIGPGDETTLAYPALVSLKMAQRRLEAGEDAGARSVLDAGKGSKVRVVAGLAASLDARRPKR